jgi:uncharacterized protein (TIGR00369 family)
MPEIDHEALLRQLIESPDNHCFVCSPTSPVGLRLRFTKDDGVVSTEFVPGDWHMGWAGVVHGGILASVLDEAMAYCLFFEGIKAVTAKMQVRYRAPVHRDDRLQVEAEITRDTRRLTDIAGRILRDGRLVAEASACFMKLGELDPHSL